MEPPRERERDPSSHWASASASAGGDQARAADSVRNPLTAALPSQTNSASTTSSVSRNGGSCWVGAATMSDHGRVLLEGSRPRFERFTNLPSTAHSGRGRPQRGSAGQPGLSGAPGRALQEPPSSVLQVIRLTHKLHPERSEGSCSRAVRSQRRRSFGRCAPSG